MRFTYLLISFCLLTPLFMRAAEHSCKVPNQFARVMKSYFMEHEFEEESNPVTPVPVGTLVMVRILSTYWEQAIVKIWDSGDAMIKVFLCNKGLDADVHCKNIRVLKPLQQLSWQTFPPIAATKALIDSFLCRLTSPNNSKLPLGIRAMLVPSTQKIVVAGDLHGAVTSILSIVELMGEKDMIDGSLKLAPDHLMVPMGDYSDRSFYGVEIWHYLLLLKEINGLSLIALRGNHETDMMAKEHEFLSEWKRKIGENFESRCKLSRLFSTLPHALLIGFKHDAPPYYRFLFLCHGGIDENLDLKPAMEQVIKKYRTQKTLPVIEDIPLTQSSDMLQSLLWNEFVANESEQSAPMGFVSDRGPDVKAYNTSAAKLYIGLQHIDAPEEISCRLDAIVCAHAHVPRALAKLRDYVVNARYWDPIRAGEKCRVKEGDVFTCNASEESSYENIPSYASGHYSTFMPTAEGSWQAAAY